MTNLINTPALPVIPTDTLGPTDLLGRQDFVSQLIIIAESLSANKESACYAINGEWGIGKTFVIEAFENQIALFGQEGTTISKYLVFHYNCLSCVYQTDIEYFQRKRNTNHIWARVSF